MDKIDKPPYRAVFFAAPVLVTTVDAMPLSITPELFGDTPTVVTPTNQTKDFHLVCFLILIFGAWYKCKDTMCTKIRETSLSNVSSLQCIKEPGDITSTLLWYNSWTCIPSHRSHPDSHRRNHTSSARGCIGCCRT